MQCLLLSHPFAGWFFVSSSMSYRQVVRCVIGVSSCRARGVSPALRMEHEHGVCRPAAVLPHSLLSSGVIDSTAFGEASPVNR